MEVHGKTCTRCQIHKPLDEYFKQGTRHESFCKKCKKEARSAQKNKTVLPEPVESNTTVPNSPEKTSPKEPKSYEDLGLSKEDFFEIVDFFQELIKLDKLKG